MEPIRAPIDDLVLAEEAVAAYRSVCERFSDKEGTNMLSAMYRTQKDNGERHAVIEKDLRTGVEKDLRVGPIFTSTPTSTREAVGTFHAHPAGVGDKPLDSELFAMLVSGHEVMCIAHKETVCYEPAPNLASDYFDVLVKRARGIQGGYNKFRDALVQRYGKFTIQTQEERSIAGELRRNEADFVNLVSRNIDVLFKRCTLGGKNE